MAKGIKFSQFVYEFVNLLLPDRCGACALPLVCSEEILCTSCLMRLPRSQSHRWTCRLLEEKIFGRFPFHEAFSFLIFSPTGVARELLHQIKYEGRYDLAYHLGRLYGIELLRDNVSMQADYIVPVPLHWRRGWWRGYNQAEFFARGFADIQQLHVCPNGLIRKHHGSTQTKETRFERWNRMDGQYTWNQKVRIEGKTIILVDDVITTASTLSSCAGEALKAGASQVGLLTLAVVR